MADGGCLENNCVGRPTPWVRIPRPPLDLYIIDALAAHPEAVQLLAEQELLAVDGWAEGGNQTVRAECPAAVFSIGGGVTRGLAEPQRVVWAATLDHGPSW